jgi:hypothetical protein
LQSNAVSDVMSFSALLKRLFSLVLFLLAAVKHKKFAADEEVAQNIYERDSSS